MGCRLLDFNIQGAFAMHTVKKHKVEVALATYKPLMYRGKIIPSPDLGTVTLYKVDGKFQGARMCDNLQTVLGHIAEELK